MFYGCTALSNITWNESNKKEFKATIGDYAFYGCTSLADINIPKQVSSIGGSAFSNCTALSNITFNENDTVEFSLAIGNYAFNGCVSLTYLSLPDSVTSLGRYMIRGTGITSITIPKNVSSSGYDSSNGALAGAKELTSVTFADGMTKIPGYILASSSQTSYVEKVVIPESVTEIGSYAFFKCTNLKDITILSSVDKIEGYAFDGCDKEKLVMHVMQDSYAEQYAIANGWQYDYNLDETIKNSLRLTVQKITVNDKVPPVILRNEGLGSTYTIKIKFNFDVKVNDGGTYTIYYYLNDKRYNITENMEVMQEEDKREIIIMSWSVLPKGKIYFEFSDNAIAPSDSNVSFDLSDINGSFDNNADFIYRLDTFSFGNFIDAIGEDKYSFSDNAIKKLRENGISENEINKMKKTDWGGICYGMTNFISMSKRGTLDISSFVENGADSYTSNYNVKVPEPKNSTETGGVRDTLNYLFMLQKGVGMSNGDGTLGLGNGDFGIKFALQDLNSMDFKMLPVTINIVYKEKGHPLKVHKHSILPYRRETIGNSTANGAKIYCYDPNYLYDPTIISFDGSYNNVTITNEASNGEYYDIVGLGYDYVNIAEGCYSGGLSAYTAEDAVNESTKISVLLDGSFEISNGNDIIYYTNGSFSGATNIVKSAYIYGGGATDSAAEMELELPKGNYTVKSENGNLNCTYDSGDTFAYITTVGSANVALSEGAVQIEGNNIESSALLSFDGTGSDSIIIDSSDVNDITFAANDNNKISIETDENTSSSIIKIDESVQTDEQKVVGSAYVDFSGNKLSIDDTITAIYGDADGNGVLTATDAAQVLQKVLNDSYETGIELKGIDYIKYLDVNADSIVSASDAAYVLQKVLSSSLKFPCEVE